MNYQDIDFGEMSAEEELDKNPELIVEGFYDFKGSLSKIIEKQDFLVLGNKGSGKSIIGEHMKATSGLQSDGTTRFVSKFGMKEFPYKSFTKIIPGDIELEAKFPIAWQWALLVQVILSFSADFGKSTEFSSEFDRAVESLRGLGIIPSTSLSELARISSNTAFKVRLAQFEISGDSKTKDTTDLLIAQLVSHLKILVSHLQSENKHFIVIDGLDDQLSEKNNQLLAVASLISEAGDLNRFFRENLIPMKIVILCRKDIHSKLPGANKNKMGGYTVNLNWYEDQVEFKKKNIIKLVHHRAKVAGYSDDIFESNFQKEYADGKDVYDYLLDNTRYTPRDFLRLLSTIKEFKNSQLITAAEIDKAVKKYSVDYFWPEVEDELDGYFERSEISTLKKALIHFRKREFFVSDFTIFCNENGYDLRNSKGMFAAMYECGAISNRVDGLYFSRMRDQNDFNEKILINIHRGALKALAISSS